MVVVIPERQALENWALKHDLSDDFKSLCANPKERKFILDEPNNIGHKHQHIGHLTKGFNPPSVNMLYFHGPYLALAIKTGIVDWIISLTFVLVNHVGNVMEMLHMLKILDTFGFKGVYLT
ncbi:hypothetical protein RYX36_030761 [Vicia faba]